MISFRHKKVFRESINKIPRGCWEWVGHRFWSGYGRIYIKPKYRRAHRVSWEIKHGEIPKGMCVCHKCDNPACVRPSHLFLATHAENMIDKKNKNRAYRMKGVEHHQCKLTEKQVREIRKKYVPYKMSTNKLGKIYGVSKATIQAIISSKSWTHLV